MNNGKETRIEMKAENVLLCPVKTSSLSSNNTMIFWNALLAAALRA
jgi:hypothetical protein